MQGADVALRRHSDQRAPVCSTLAGRCQVEACFEYDEET